jgi:glycosyltransferase involved in cell wall biosynthesis
MKIAIIDIIGIPYDGTTVFKQGLGGSESAVTFVSRELAKLGFEVTVFNNCNIDHAKPGTYDNVTYCPLSDLALDHYFDIVISSRTVIPFTDPKDYAKLGDRRAMPFIGMNLYNRILSKAKQRVLWMHDTFCLGDNLIEELATSNKITDIFTLSDWHLTYIANCDHGKRRNFEVLKNKLFITRNGVNIYNKEVDIKAKDRDLFVYNASVTKGMIPLVKQIWPHVKRHIPNAKLKVIGGYYRFSESAEPDQQEKDWRAMAADPELAKLDIDFTGVISQKEIADILTKANFMLYPAAFPETFGISSLESICYNTPIITCKFGALEEIALEGSCYLIDYAIQPNGLFPNINVPQQVEQFVKTTVEAYRNPYLHQQKQYYCNIVKDIAGWDSVALQWKQHFYHKTGSYLSRDEYRQVSKINRRWHKIFKRRYHNTVELESYKSGFEQKIVVISTFYNCERYIARCIESVACQDYDNYQHILIDDASTDGTIDAANDALSKLPDDIRKKFTLIGNIENVGAVCNQV